MANLTVKVGPAATFDAVAYTRAMIADDVTPFSIPDSRLSIYLDVVAKDFSRFIPLDDLVGTPYTNTSPLNTAVGQQRYVCTTGNGFVASPTRIVAVQGTSTGLNAASDSAYFFLDPYITARGFLGPAAIDQPAQRVIRDSYLDELGTYGKSFYDVVRDRATGLMALDIYPIPSTVYPLYVRYQAVHVQGGSGTNLTYATVPEEYTQAFGELLYAQVLFEEATRLAQRTRVTAGQITREADPSVYRDLALDTRERVYNELGGAGAVALVG